MFALRDYQLTAVSQLKSGSILKGGVGSGKSLTALIYYYTKECGAIVNKGGFSPPLRTKPLYIITTAKKRDSHEWEGDIQKFPNDISDVTIDSWNNIGKYTNVCGAFFIFDEHKAIGNGKWAKSLIQISKKNHWVVLTATPGDTWMDYATIFIANGFYKNRTEFCREHVIYNRFAKYPKIDRYQNVHKLVMLKKKIVVEMEYIRPTEVHVENISVNYDIKKMDCVQKTRWNVFTSEPIQNAAEYCATLRKVSNMSEERMEKTKELINEHPKLIIFYNFDYELEILRDICSKTDRQVAEWNGHKHCDIPRCGRWVYLVQYTAGAEAWNCIETNVILFYSLNYSYKATIQSMGRIDRMNTPYTDLYYYFLHTPSLIDMMISRALLNKEDFNEDRFYKTSNQAI